MDFKERQKIRNKIISEINSVLINESPFEINKETLPFFQMEKSLMDISKSFKLENINSIIIIDKIENSRRKILMFYKAIINTLNEEEIARIEVGNQWDPLIGIYENNVLYNLEAMILFARSFLDISTYIFSTLLINKRVDSFRKFCLKILNSDDSALSSLKIMILNELNSGESWITTLASIETRSLRDKIAHQTVIKLRYYPINEISDKEYCYVVYDDFQIPLERFIEKVFNGLNNFIHACEDLIFKKISPSEDV